MNSYPSEFLTQLGPVMFIAGLDVVPDTSQSDTETSEDDRILGRRLQGDPFVLLAKRLREVLQDKSIKKGTVWVGDTDRAGPGFRMILVDKNIRFPPQKATGQDAHSPLSPLTQTSPLYPDGLIAPIWVRKHTELLPSVFVLFLRLYESPVRPSNAPISPLHSHVFNDKVRRSLYSRYQVSETNLNPSHQWEQDEDRRRDEERKHDSELSAEIAIRKRGCNERGVKLTVVLMASRKMLDDPNLDTRLTYIRRQSGLDSRAALFVLSPVGSAELQEFVKRWSTSSHRRNQLIPISLLTVPSCKSVNNLSLQSALYDAALEYYLNHSKRVRRKRNRHAATTSSGQGTTYGYVGVPSSAAFSSRAPSQPLRPQGWIVRCEYKLACFAEFRGEVEVARKHFQTSWETLVEMFGSIAILPPRTKRWAEAKVLADCISVKIVKLYLYRAEHSRAVAHFNAHLMRFADFSRGWGIGEETWEFWSWTARWHRILAELLDMATSSTLTIPQVLPSFPIKPPTPDTMNQLAAQNVSLEPMRPAGVNPSSVLQHPGFYYYAAAICTQRRLEQFNTADQEFPVGTANAPATLVNERKVDHRVIILELYTKAYELFKKHTHGQGQSRLTFYIACRIAQTYHDSGKFDMAIRFFERIAKTYRKERWSIMLRTVLSMWYACARQMGDIESTVKLLIEMMSCGSPDDFEVGQIEEDLTAVLHSTSPSTTPFTIDFSDMHPLFQSSVVFWHSENSISQPAPFQLHLKAPSSVSLTIFHFVSLRVVFSNHQLPVIVRHRPPFEAADLKSLQLVDLGIIPTQSQEAAHEVFADLRWPIGGTIVFTGTLGSESPTILHISKVVLNVVEGQWSIEMILDPSVSRDITPSKPRWLSHLAPPTFLPIQRNDPSETIVRHRPHLVDVSFSHAAPAYLDEEYPITISVTNVDDHDLSVVVDVLLQPAEDDTVNHIIIGTTRSTTLIKSVSYGSLSPGSTVEKTLLLHSTGAAGDRTIDVSVQCEPSEPRTPTEAISPISPRLAIDISEKLHTLVIPTKPALQVDSLASYRRAIQPPRGPPLGLTDLKSYDPSTFSAQAEAVIRSTIVNQGPWDVVIETFSFLPTMENIRIKLLGCSLDGDDDVFPLHCNVGDVYSVISRFMIFAQDEVELPETLPSPGKYQISWSRVGSLSGALALTPIPLPHLNIPSDSVDALLELPAAGKLHVPITATLKIRNRHPWRTADVYLQVESSDHFVLSGLRSGSLPILLAGSEEHIVFNLIPVSCGTVRLPTVKLLDRRRENQDRRSGEEIEVEKNITVIDARLEERNDNGEEIRLMVSLPGDDESNRLRRIDAEGLSMSVAPA